MALQPSDNETYIGKTIEHYRILDLLGHGGMGEVYLAEDERLRRDVAIKVLPRRLARDEVTSRRFVREARIASQVVHPYIATVFDVVRQHDDLYLVMELIHGRTLREILKIEDVSRDERLRWALEITEALCAIHRVGLVHRDVKPGNVMITPEGHAKVMDFGLARHTPVDTVLDTQDESQTTVTEITQAGVGVGTVLYMSPEQLRAEPVDGRSDLFSLGILLYELVTRVHPFKKATGPASASAILRESPGGGHDPQSLSEIGPIHGLVLRLLEKRPMDRYQNSDEVLTDLKLFLRPGAIAADTKRRSRRKWWIAAGVTAVVLLIAAGGQWWSTRPPVALEPRVAIALVPFVDQTGEANGHVLAGMAADFLAIDLDASRLVRSVGPRDTTPLLSDLAPDRGADEIARRIHGGMSVDYVLLGTLYREDDTYLASMAFAATGPDTPELADLQGRGATVAELVENLGSELRRNLPDVSRVNAWRDGRTPVAELTSDSEVASLLYQQGLLALREQQWNAAIDNFEKAIATDAEFVLAHVRLAEALHAVGYSRWSREVAERAFQLAPRGQGLAEQRLDLQVRATRAEVFNRKSEAVELTNRLVNSSPGDPAALARSAAALSSSGEYDVALERIERAIDIDPLSPSLRLARAQILLRLSRADETLSAVDMAQAMFESIGSRPGVARARFLKGQALGVLGRLPDSMTELELAVEDYEQSGNPLLAAMAVQEKAMANGQPAAMIDALGETARLARDAGNLGLECRSHSRRGAYLYQMGKYEAAETDLRLAIDQARVLENDLLLVAPLSNLGGMLAYVGRLEEARPELTAAVELSRKIGQKPVELSSLRKLSDVDYQQGRLDQALESLDKILAESQGNDSLQQGAAWTHLYRAEIQDRRGLSLATLESASHAIEDARRLSLSDVLGYGLVRRAGIRAALGRFDGATEDLDEAMTIASAPDANLEDLQARCLIARGVLSMFGGNWNDAVQLAGEALGHPGGAAPTVQAEARTLACQASIEQGEFQAAVTHCTAAVEQTSVPLPQQASARSALSLALLQTGQDEAARAQARIALEHADSMKLLLPAARSAAVLVAAGVDKDSEALRRRGRQSLDEYVRSAPEDARESMRGHADLRRIASSLADG